MADIAKLYTPEVLGLATGLSGYLWDDSLPLKGEGRSKTCGSAIALGFALDAIGQIDRIAVKSQACAIGQAAAAIFAAQAAGKGCAEISASRDQIIAWLEAGGELPDWPGLDAIAAARDFPARHAAILLPWRTASEMLP
ncbi:MAG: iron-sulfur cluster assembly scaffold protein [Sphingomonadaceae bacterium]